MHDPLPEIAGIQSGDLIGGFCGALVHLMFCEELGMFQLLSTVASGVAAAAYVTPMLIWLTNIPESLEDGMAFIVGLFAMAMLRVVFVVIEKIRADPLAVLSKVIKK